MPHSSADLAQNDTRHKRNKLARAFGFCLAGGFLAAGISLSADAFAQSPRPAPRKVPATAATPPRRLPAQPPRIAAIPGERLADASLTAPQVPTLAGPNVVPEEPTQLDDAAASDLAAAAAAGNPGQILLKEAAEKAKTAADDAQLSEVIAIAEEGLKEKPGQEGTAFGRKLLAWAYNKRGQKYAENQIYDMAVEDFTLALQYDPTLWKAVHNRGVSHASLQHPREALADFERALQMNKTHANTWFNRGQLHYELGAYDKAWRDFNEALRLNPQDAAFIAGRGQAAVRLGKVREAMQDLDFAVKADPRNAELRLARGEMYLAIKNYPIAAQEFQAAAQLNPQSGAALRGLAWIMATCPDAKLRNAEQAVSLAQKAMELEGDADPRYLETLAAAFANSGQFEAAAELAKHGLEKAQGNTAQRLTQQMAVYKEGKPWREVPTASVANAAPAGNQSTRPRQPGNPTPPR
ncbi:MAG: tetratricopeptide repeat protein [Pirellulales bacterium]|nr:tetratricopeptide repeat protein [Pirellulales bacterium]